MENKKLTNSKALEMVLAIVQEKYFVSDFSEEEKTELYCKLATMKEQVDKKSKSGKSGKPTKTQIENEKLKMVIMGTLGVQSEAKQIKEIMENERIKPLGLTNQKISALLRQMVQDGICYRMEDKRVAKFYLCETVQVTEIVEENDEIVEEVIDTIE